jgi:hypothetical protein
MGQVSYKINDKTFTFSVDGSPAFDYGSEGRLSNSENDITYGQDWYESGYAAQNFLNESEFKSFKNALTNSVADIVANQTGKDVSGFSLENYHKYVNSDDLHYKIVSITRDLFPEDFNFSLTDIIPKFERLLGFELTDVDPDTGERIHIIIRINRPSSTDFNPPHKDIYGRYDEDSRIAPFINIWVPISGVTQNSSLPIVPSSHFLPENKILRTFEGGVIEGKKYRVRTVKEWNGSNELIRPEVNDGEVLFFTPHLVHGMAINEEDMTRVSLEFRLFKKD